MWPAIQRMLSILFGFGIAVLAQILVLPVFARRQLTQRLADALQDSVTLIYASAMDVSGEPAGQAQPGGGSGGASGGASGPSAGGSKEADSKAKAAGKRSAVLQREQRKKAAGLDSLLGPTAVVSGGGAGDRGMLQLRRSG